MVEVFMILGLCRADVQSESVRHDQVPTKIEQFTSNKKFGDEGVGEVGVRPGKTKADLKELAVFFFFFREARHGVPGVVSQQSAPDAGKTFVDS